MRCNPFRWLLGVLPVLFLGGVAILGEREWIEGDLTARSQMALEQAGHSGVKTTFEGRDARVTGLAFDEAEPDRVAKTVARTHGVRIVHNDTKLIDKAERHASELPLSPKSRDELAGASLAIRVGPGGREAR